MSELTEFVLARIAEREEAANLATTFEMSYAAAWAKPSPAKVQMDPARVLAECAALRKIVAEHALYDPEHAMNEAEWWGDDKPLDDRQQACSRCGYPREFAAPWPCPTLRALATIWADHPDYRPEEWA